MFKRLLTFLIIYIFVHNFTFGQKVGLVLSGGGAKGAAHIGLIKALEENGIPIDYIGGTSIGAIVGGLYSMGYTPEEMLNLFLSDEFYYWQTGKVETDYSYYFKKPFETPEFMRFMIPLKDSTSVMNYLPTNLINPIQMNQAFMGLFAQANAVSEGNFDNLLVPFLCVAADVYNKRPIIFRSGDLGDAIRASMTFPFVFKPIIQDSVPLYDGGIYNNFPIRPVRNAFHPDFIIGSSLQGAKKERKIDHSLYGQLESMVMQKTDYSVSSDLGIMFRFSLEDVSLLDFKKAKTLYDIGYEKGIQMVDSIKTRVKRTVTQEEMNERRAEFKGRMPQLLFKNIIINGVSPSQEEYIKSQFLNFKEDAFDFDGFKKGYFMLLADSKIKEIIPHAKYNEDTNFFDLILDVKIKDEIMVAFGGNVSSANANQLYLGLGYKSLTEYSANINLDMQVGNAYNGIMLHTRIEPPYRFPVYLQLMGAFNYRKFYESEKLFIDDNLATFMQQREAYIKLAFGMPFENKGRCEIRLGFGSLEDKYFQKNTILNGIDFDKSTYNLFSIATSIEKNTFDVKQFPIKGMKHTLIAEFVTGKEKYKPGSIYSPLQSADSEFQSWLQMFGSVNNFYEASKKFNWGYLLEGVISSKNLQSNYTASIMQAPAFTPTPHSELVFNEAFRANQYLAAGFIPIFKMSNIVHLRGHFDLFAPIYPIKYTNENQAYYGNLFSDVSYLGEMSLVFQLPFLSISLYGNYYSFPKSNWNFGLNIGYLIFNPKFL